MKETKEKLDENIAEKTTKATAKKSASATKATTKKSNSDTKKSTKSATKKSDSVAKKSTKSTTKKSDSAAKKSTKSAAKKSDSATKKSTKSAVKKTTRATSKKSTSSVINKVPSSKNSKLANPISEYYDLPYRYNQTLVRILAQTPHALFIYWDISDKDRENMINTYGENFFNDTKPILIIHNETLNYSFSIDIDDFTNSWYLRTPTSNCSFTVELGRRFLSTTNEQPSSKILHIATSNTLQSPNDHILEESFNQTILIKNVKTNEILEIPISKFKHIPSIYSKYDVYKNELMNNPSSDFLI